MPAATSSGGDYTVAADDTSDGDLDVVSFLPGDGVDADTVPRDLFGNPLTSTTLPTNMIADTQDIVVDTLAPTLTVSVDQSSVKAGDQVTVTLTSSEPLDGTAGDVMGALTTPNLSMVAGSATVAGDIYTATYEALADVEDATNEVSVAAGALGDAAGNTNAAVSSANYVVDSVTPEIDGIVRVGPNDAATGELTNADTLHFRVNFSEPVDLSTVTPRRLCGLRGESRRI